MQPLLEVSGLSHLFGSRRVLSDVQFAVSKGGVIGLLGPNGSGKSTALSVVAGLIPQQTGEIRYCGRAIRGHDRQFRSETAVVFQSPSLDKKLTAQQNLELAASMHGLGARAESTRIRALLGTAGLAQRANDRVSTFSGGMTRRLDIARALLPRPKLVLMDEPTSGLDEVACRTLWDTLDEMRRGEDTAVVVATHRPDEAERCDTLIVLSQGCVVATDSPQGLRSTTSRDWVVLSGDEPGTLASQISATFRLKTLTGEQEVYVECDEGHMWIPKLVSLFPSGRLSSVSLRRPSLADVFLKLTGSALDRQHDDAPSDHSGPRHV